LFELQSGAREARTRLHFIRGVIVVVFFVEVSAAAGGHWI
jgi:hypothetical protein